MKKLSLIIASSFMLSTTAFATKNVISNDVAKAVTHVNDVSFSDQEGTENIQQLKKLVQNAKANNYIAAVVNTANLVSITAPQYNAFNTSQDLYNMSDNLAGFTNALKAVVNNYPMLDKMDQALTQAYTELQAAWDHRVTFLNGESGEHKAYEFNYLLNYLTVNGVNVLQKGKSIDETKDFYVKLNTLAYSIPTDAFNSYYQARDMAVEAVYSINKNMVVSALQNVQSNAKVQKLSEATNDIDIAINDFLNLSYSFKFLGKTIEIKLIPDQVKDMVHNALQKSGFNDTKNALNFLLISTAEGQKNIPLASDYNNIKDTQDNNVFARLMVTLSTMLSQNINNNMQDPQFHITDEQAYYVITYQLAELVNKNLV
ncbi:hypothetical protein [Cysteiniphilum sp. QT6929]|uniref:hypothetical protein n=1 Tax=Cysteiniphilum sp. QT6929 TaxID=2975055 RepID=UPI0024B34D56|nr:hypothetical protein [Cysteiniphilum sp. QT6929]WHN66204.1 hypothetical protein NYP54_02960 [Cysteiniphilum sp. QT6929]